MRILIATRYVEVEGGTEGYLRSLIPALVARGHQIAILYEEPVSNKRARVDDGVPGLEMWRYSSVDKSIPQEVVAWKPDIVYLQGYLSSYYESLLLDRFPVISFAHNYLGTCISGNKRFAVPMPMPCQRVLGPACLALYLPRRCGGLNVITMIRSYRAQRRRQAVFHKHRGIVVASRHMRDEFLRHGVPAERIHLAPYFAPRAQADPLPPGNRPFRNRILFAGRMTDLKGGLELVKAVSLAVIRLERPLQLVAIGDGPDRSDMEALAAQLNVAATFTGWVDTDIRDKWLRESDIVAMPSLWPEPYGLVGLEAGCFGVPAVGFAVGGIPDWLDAGVTGELAPGDPPTADGLADAIVRALGDHSHWLELCHGAWEFARVSTVTRHVEWLEPLLERVKTSSA